MLSPLAKLLTAIDRRCISDVPGIDLAQTCAATTLAHPILPKVGRYPERILMRSLAHSIET